MIVKEISYEDFNGVTRTEKFHFHLTEVEMTEMNVSRKGGFEKYVEKIVAAQDEKALLEIVKEFICKAYGVKSDDGRKFMKSPEILEDFTSTQAYVDLYMGLIDNDTSLAEFMGGVIPAKIKAKLKEVK